MQQVNWKPLYESVFFYQTPPVPLNFRTELGFVAPMSTWRLNHFVLNILRPNRVGSGHGSSPSSLSSSTSQPASSWQHIVKRDDYIIHLSLITNASVIIYAFMKPWSNHCSHPIPNFTTASMVLSLEHSDSQVCHATRVLHSLEQLKVHMCHECKGLSRRWGFILLIKPCK